ncbi:MAG: DUF805 domain-containing protein [Candidatus Uhrbacteria bacterium]|nr:DUF805 domain-containing protein [Candidatus Uhrbacteria bacterium]
MKSYEFYLEVWKKYAVVDGRAQRAEYWYFYLFSAIGVFTTVIASSFISEYLNILIWLYYLAIFIPSITLTVRRLHDTNRSGWWYFFGLVPIVGGIVLFIFMVLDSEPGENRYGPNPKGVKAA